MGRRPYRARLYRVFVPGSELRRPQAGGARRRLAALDLSALARDLLHVVDLLRLRRAGVARRLRFSRHLYRPDADGRPRLSADRQDGAARQEAEHHLGRRPDCGALRQEPGSGGDSGADRHRRHDPLHRAATQSGVVLGRHHHDGGRARRRPAADAWRQRLADRAVYGGVRGAVRHPPHRRHRASGRADAGDRHGIDRQACRFPGRRRVRHLRAVSGSVGAVHPRAREAGHRQGDHAGAAARQFLRDGGAVAVRRRAAAAAIPRQRGGEPQRGRNPPRGLAVPTLPRADQSVRHSDRDCGAAGRSDQRVSRRHVRAGAAASGTFHADDRDRIRRRPVGGDRDGDRGVGGARHHGVERHRGAASPAAPCHAHRRGEATPARGS